MITGHVPTRRRHHRRRPGWIRPLVWAAVVLVGLVAVVVVIAVLHALRLEKRINTLPATIDAAKAAAEDGRLTVALGELQQAETTLASVNSTLYNSLDLQLINLLPVAHQNLQAIRSAVGLGLQMVGGGQQILHAAAPLESADGHLEVPLRHGSVPLGPTDAVRTAIDQVATDLPIAPARPGSLVIGRVRAAEQRLYAEAVSRRKELVSVSDAIQVIDDIAGAKGNRRYLIAVANSAEMRGSGGMILSFGVLNSHDGTVSLGHFGPIDELKLSQPETGTTFPADFSKTYGDLAPTMEWRNVNVMSDFTVDAPVMEAMFTKATGLPVDGVIQVDPAGLAALLAGVGPVRTADLGTVSADNAVAVTLSTAYQLYPNRQERQDYTGEVAQAAFGRLTTGTFEGLRPLGTALVRAALSRHVMVYSSDPSTEVSVRALGFDGALPAPTGNYAQLTVQNFGANKLDYYLKSALSLTGGRPSPYGSHVTAVVDLANTAPPGATVPVEVFGPNSPGGVAGQYVGLVTLYLPQGSSLVSVQADGTVTTNPVQASQNGVPTISFTVAIPAGGHSRVSLRLYLPPRPRGTPGLNFVPTPRVNPTVYSEKLT